MKYFYTYKVQCTAIGWEDYYYLGKHVTSNLNDGYKGSGKRLKEYYEKYPDDYTFTILEFYSNKNELSIAEEILISDLWKTDPYCLNSNAGGVGSWRHVNETGRGSHIGKNNPMYGKPGTRLGKHLSDETKQKLSEAKKGQQSWMKGKKHTEEAKQKNSEAHKGKHRVYRDDGTFYMSF